MLIFSVRGPSVDAGIYTIGVYSIVAGTFDVFKKIHPYVGEDRRGPINEKDT